MAFPWSSSIFPLLIIFPGTISYRKILELRISEEFQAEFQYRRKMENLHPGKSHNRLESGSSLILAGNSLPSTFCSVFGNKRIGHCQPSFLAAWESLSIQSEGESQLMEATCGHKTSRNTAGNETRTTTQYQ
ncbi:uncharacterized protein LOC143862400 isoform X2 [Tasmannia lanceolata]|uniref:uncharacterized protein LOC143862400 isoform X2 n=1 Tax=Tasmannia lanceolata TaxID=3420 RepID=UPI004063FE4B